jgi:4-diphosphocytidyl-2-C-methyl-D-erythritol kinase
VVAFPNSKINLGLNVTHKRNDGFHDIETVFYPVAIQDALEIVQNDEPGENIQFATSGLPIEGKTQDNLCIKAYHLLKNNFPQIPPIKMHLHKTIPSGAGLGGGSADGAFTLKLLNRKFNLGLSTEKLVDYAFQLGSDSPFFIINKPCFATGRGEFLEPVMLDLSTYKFVIINPGIHINTAEAFSLLTPAAPSKSIRQIIQQSVETWREELKNDFERPVFQKYPEIKNSRDDLYKGGAIYASLTGSGSTVYGIFLKDEVPQFSFPSNYFIKILAVPDSNLIVR